jgi:hypothetical protein
MNSEEKPNEFTVLMKVLEIVDKSLQNSSKREIDQQQRVQIIQFMGSITESSFENSLSSEVQGDVVGDKYTVGQSGAVGPHAKAENIQFQQVWHQGLSGLDVAQLADELKLLRAHLRQVADTPEEDESVAEISKAQAAASEGDGVGAMQHLRHAGKWALDGATAIGTSIAVAAIKAALGIG